MEFNEATDKVIGIIEKEIPDKNVKIKVLALLSTNGSVTRLSDHHAKTLFPPNGYIFEPGFFYNFKYSLNEMVAFKVEKNEKAVGNQDVYKIKSGQSEIKVFGIEARKIEGFKRDSFATNLDIISSEDKTDGTFYGVTGKFLVGRLRSKNGKIEPALHRRIRIWDLDNKDLLISENTYRLIKKPLEEDSWLLDCLSDKQLFEWFRDYLKKIEPEYVKLLDQNSNWRNKLPDLFSSLDEEKLKIDKIRLDRIEKKFDMLTLSKDDIQTFINTSGNLKRVFTESIEKHKEEFKEIYQQELDQHKKEIEQQTFRLTQTIKELENRKKEKENLLKQLSASIETTTNEINILKENKDRIINDFAIIKEVLQCQVNEGKTSHAIPTHSYVIEEIKSIDYGNIKNQEEFGKQLKHRLFMHSLNPAYARPIMDRMACYNAILLKDIKIGIAISEATQNAKYIIRQVEADWLHFSDLWNNGLGELWNSAIQFPEVFHFLFLEDINMSAPECYFRPLKDILNGIRRQIPYGKTSFPSNLRVFATIAPSDDPAIGLPMHRETFEGWGTLGFLGNLLESSEYIQEPETKFLSTDFFIHSDLEETDKELIKNNVRQEFNIIFET